MRGLKPDELKLLKGGFTNVTEHTLLDRLAKCRRLIKKIEWGREHYDPLTEQCVACAGSRDTGHDKDCELVKLLKGVEW
jgi:hypothetical protein